MTQSSGIYKITCSINGSYYYGSASNFCRRWKRHKTNLRHHAHPNPILQNVWNKYNEVSFIFEIDMECPIEKLLQVEQVYLDIYVGRPGCMNIARYVGGYSMLGRKHTLETCKKISDRLRGRKYGPMSKETRRRISEARKNQSPEERLRNSQRQRLRTSIPEVRQVMSEAAKKRFRDEPYTNEYKRKISDGMKGHWRTHKMTDEQKHKISDAMKTYWCNRKLSVT